MHAVRIAAPMPTARVTRDGVQEPAQEVAADVIGAEERRLAAGAERAIDDGVGIVRREHRREQRDGGDRATRKTALAAATDRAGARERSRASRSRRPACRGDARRDAVGPPQSRRMRGSATP